MARPLPQLYRVMVSDGFACSLAVTCGMLVKGWDATTGYLQTKQRVPVYAYLPSHYGYSDLDVCNTLVKIRKILEYFPKTHL